MDLHEIKKTISRPELLQIAETVARDKSIEQEVVIKSMEQAIQSVAKRKYGQELDVKAEINRKTGEIELGRVLNVVENIEIPSKEISLEDGKKRDSAAMLGDYFIAPLPP